MGSGLIPFDNIFSSPDGYIARQAKGNSFRNRLFTWEFSRNGNSFVTIPLPILSLGQPASDESKPVLPSPWSDYLNFEDFLVHYFRNNLGGGRILNLNNLPTLLMAIVSRHFTLMRSSTGSGLSFVKARIENVWRTVPFVDLPEYVEHVSRFGLPVIQGDQFLVPPGSSLGTFIEASADPMSQSDHEKFEVNISSELLLHLMMAFGIPSETLSRFIEKFVTVSLRDVKPGGSGRSG